MTGYSFDNFCLELMCVTCGKDYGHHYGLDCDEQPVPSRRFTPKAAEEAVIAQCGPNQRIVVTGVAAMPTGMSVTYNVVDDLEQPQCIQSATEAKLLADRLRARAAEKYARASIPHVPSLGTPECPCQTCLRWREYADRNPGVEFTQPYYTIEVRQLELSSDPWWQQPIDAYAPDTKPKRGTWTRGMVNPSRY